MIQGSAEWVAARLGKVTASRVNGVFTKPKTGLVSKVREALFADLLSERLTGKPAAYDFADEAARSWGAQTEPFARAAYMAQTHAAIELCGFVDHPTVPMAGASPDGVVGLDGMVEIKCPNTETHKEYCRKRTIPKSYREQIKWGLACTGRRWCDFISFDPRADEQQLFIQRVEPFQNELRAMEIGVFAFVMELEARVAAHRWSVEDDRSIDDAEFGMSP